MDKLIGVGLYTPAEAGRLLHVPAAKISRWLRSHQIKGHNFGPLWAAQVSLDDGRSYLGFRDLMEVRIADKFISLGVSSQRVRAAIVLAREIIGDERPLSTDGFRTDGRNIFLRVIENDERGEERERLLNLFSRQYEFRQIVEPLLKSVDFDGARGAGAMVAVRSARECPRRSRALFRPADQLGYRRAHCDSSRRGEARRDRGRRPRL